MHLPSISGSRALTCGTTADCRHAYVGTTYIAATKEMWKIGKDCFGLTIPCPLPIPHILATVSCLKGLSETPNVFCFAELLAVMIHLLSVP